MASERCQSGRFARSAQRRKRRFGSRSTLLQLGAPPPCALGLFGGGGYHPIQVATPQEGDAGTCVSAAVVTVIQSGVLRRGRPGGHAPNGSGRLWGGLGPVLQIAVWIRTKHCMYSM